MEALLLKPNKKRLNALFWVLFAIALALSIWKLAYGFGWFDEAFYITIPHRMLLGDAFIADEWHPAQLFGFLTMPFVAAYRLVRGDMNGIMLFMRVVYLVFHFLVGIFLYRRLSKEYEHTAILCAFSFMIFTPFDIMAPSYNSIGVDALVFLGVGLATEENNGSLLLYILYGAIYAVTVLCCPYMVILLPAFIALALLEKKKDNPLLPVKGIGFFVLGISFMLLLFILFEFSRTDIGTIVCNFPQLFRDAEHSNESVFSKLSAYFNHAPHYFAVSLAIYGLNLLGLVIDKSRKQHAAFWIGISCIATLWAYAWSYANLNEYYNGLMMPLFFPGLVAYFLLDKKPKRLFVFVTLAGLIYSICMCLSSNVGFHAVSLAYSVVNVASWCYIGNILSELIVKQKNEVKKTRRFIGYAAVAALCGTLCCLLFLQIKTKATHVFYDDSPAQLTVTIPEGPAKGIKTTSAKANEYRKFYKDVTDFTKGHDGESLLVLSTKTWCYLMKDDLGYATFSAWLSGVNEGSVTRLEEYFQIHEEKKPDLIYIEKPFYLSEDETAQLADKYGFDLNESNCAYQLIKKPLI